MSHLYFRKQEQNQHNLCPFTWNQSHFADISSERCKVLKILSLATPLWGGQNISRTGSHDHVSHILRPVNATKVFPWHDCDIPLYGSVSISKFFYCNIEVFPQLWKPSEWVSQSVRTVWEETTLLSIRRTIYLENSSPTSAAIYYLALCIYRQFLNLLV